MNNNHDIKKFKPNNSHYTQGIISSNKMKKLFESQYNKPIIYRSSWEMIFINWLEHSNSVKYWGSESLGINYYNPIKKRMSTYYPDFIVEFTDGSIHLFEIKPKHETIKPKNTNNKYKIETYITNISKWKSAKEYCINNNMKFSIITEDTINKLI